MGHAAQPPSRQEAEAQYQHRQRRYPRDAEARALHKEQTQRIGGIAQGVKFPRAVGRRVHGLGRRRKEISQQRAAVQHDNGADEPGHQTAQQAAAAHRRHKDHQVQQHGHIALGQHQVARQYRRQRHRHRHQYDGRKQRSGIGGAHYGVHRHIQRQPAVTGLSGRQRLQHRGCRASEYPQQAGQGK